MMHKLGTVVVNNTDNLLISAFVDVVSVGIYSNYYLYYWIYQYRILDIAQYQLCFQLYH